MRRTRITNEIEYVEPSKMSSWWGCSGIIVHSSPKMVIDTSPGGEDTLALLKAEDPDIAIITHFHIDHSLMGPIVSDQTSADLFIPSGDELYLTSIEDYLRQVAPAQSEAREFWRQEIISHGYRELDNYDLYDDITDFGMKNREMMQVIRIPGHSKGHSSFYFPQDRIIFAADIGLDKFGPWYGFPNCDLLEYIDSILRLMRLDLELVITSHNGIISQDITHAFGRCIKIICDRESMICRKLDEGYTPEQIIEDGIFYSDKASMQQPLRSFFCYYDELAFQHHYQLIKNGGILKYFPGIVGVLEAQ